MSAMRKAKSAAEPRPELGGIDGTAAIARRRRRVRRVLVTVVLICVVGSAVAVVFRGRDAGAGPPVVAAKVNIGAVSSKSITSDASLDGTVAYSAAPAIQSLSAGRLTYLAPTGAKIDQGQILFSVDGVPTVLMIGVVPAYRDLNPSVDAGPDLVEFQTALKALGDDPDNLIAVGAGYDSATSSAAARWQQRLGLNPTGLVPLGSMIFEPAAVTVGVAHATLGSPVNRGTQIADAELPTITMQFTIPIDAKTAIAIGQSVDVTMPDRSNAKGMIQSIGTALDANGNTITVGRGVVQPSTKAAAITDLATVKVRISQMINPNALVVAANALNKLLDGTYTVTVVQSDGTSRAVGVTVGVSSNGSVQITGQGIAEGTKVVLPSTV